MSASDDLELVVAGRRMLTPTVAEFELTHPHGEVLPAFDPGAHLPITTPSGARRRYSLTGPPHERRRYVIAVRRDGNGRGGSTSMVDDLRAGMSVRVRTPGNGFALGDAQRYVLIAGGIGITPVRAIFHQLIDRRAAVRLLYLNRSRRETAYLDELGADSLAAHVTLHFTDESGRADLWPVLAEPAEDSRVYCCGPTSLMDAVEMLTMHWRPSSVHFERFIADTVARTAAPFDVIWAPDGRRVHVAPKQSMLQAMRAGGLSVDSSCESGTCGTCRLRLIAGAADHRDVVLSKEERSHAIMPCVSRGHEGPVTVAPW